tara:strand:+ start:445 stop:726 length:282 start_codon:yes stop_codon:yes gene_type:complete
LNTYSNVHEKIRDLKKLLKFVRNLSFFQKQVLKQVPIISISKKKLKKQNTFNLIDETLCKKNKISYSSRRLFSVKKLSSLSGSDSLQSPLLTN